MAALVRAQSRSRIAEVALAFAVGVASFALVAVTVAGTEPGGITVVVAVACLAAVVAIARRWGVVYAAPPAIASVLAYDWFQFPPTHPHALPGAAELANLLTYLAVAVLIGELAAHARRRAEVSEEARSELAREQAALRRVATLVARGGEPPRSPAPAGGMQRWVTLIADAWVAGRWAAERLAGRESSGDVRRSPTLLLASSRVPIQKEISCER